MASDRLRNARLFGRRNRFSDWARVARGCSAALFAAGVLWTLPCAAQSASDKAAAEALFDEGVELLKAGDYAPACKKLESSQRVDPGIGTLLYLGECYKKWGKSASAWATFREAASKAEAAGEEDRARVGMQRADEIEPTLSRVTFDVADENLDIEGLSLKQGDRPVLRALWGTAVPVDPGQLQVVAEAPGYEPWKTTVLVGEGGSAATLTVPALVKLPEEPAPPAAAPVERKPQPQVSMTQDELKKPGSGQKTAGLIVAGLGVVGVGVGSAFGILAMQAENDASEFCDGETCLTGTDGLELTDQARRNALVSTIGFAAGGALLVGGLTLYFTAPKNKESAKLRLSPTPFGGHFSYEASF